MLRSCGVHQVLDTERLGTDICVVYLSSCLDTLACHATAAKVKLRESDFRPTIALNRNLTIAASGDTSAGNEPVLDFDHGINFIVVSCDAVAGPG